MKTLLTIAVLLLIAGCSTAPPIKDYPFKVCVIGGPCYNVSKIQLEGGVIAFKTEDSETVVSNQWSVTERR